MDNVQEFIERWEISGAAERTNYQLFLSELCDVLDVPHPDPATPDNRENAPWTRSNVTSSGHITHRAPTSSGLYWKRSSTRCARNGARWKPPRSSSSSRNNLGKR